MIKKIVLITCAVVLLLTGCGSKEPEQVKSPGTGDTVGVLKTSMGDIKFKLFPKEAPKAVENFKKLAEKGYYNNLIFHRVMNEFMIQGGDPEGTGYGGESIWGKPFEDEISKDLHYFRGALAMANNGPNTNGSQFFIVQKSKVAGDEIEIMKQLKFDQSLIDQYSKLGGASWLEKGFPMANGDVSNGYTIFGQVYDGMKVVDKIAAVEVDKSSKPVKDVKMLGIEITEYK